MNDQSLEAQRHSAAHLLALTVQELYPQVKLGIGPPIEHGFYYDFEFPEPISSDDLPKIEARMRQAQADGLGFAHEELPIDQAIAKLEAMNQPYKTELVKNLAVDGAETVSFFTTGNFVDLCRGGHVEDTKEIGPFKLTHLAGAYWLGDEKNPMLTRIYAAQAKTQAELDEYLTMIEEAKKRDHRKLGRELDLFTFSDLVGAGLPLFTPRGTILRNEITRLIADLQAPHGYSQVWIPHITKRELYEVSGHWQKFQADLFHVKGKGDSEFVLKPMNCPHHNQIYLSRNRSYRDLPIRYAEVTTNYRDELPGELNGLSRVRSLTQDDGHIYCRLDQISDEIMKMYVIIDEFYKTFDLKFKVRFSRRDPEHSEQFLGDAAVWQQAEDTLKQILVDKQIDYIDGPGEAAFYGPKLDFMVTDAIGRKWQVATIQLDFIQPERFGLTYTDDHGQEVQPVMIHRAIAGSIERFLAMLIEHYAGAFPLWLAPTQITVLPVSDKVADYGAEVTAALVAAGVRAELWQDETLGKRIRQSEMMKVPLTVIVGEQETEARSVSLRSLTDKDMGKQSLPQFVDRVRQAIAARTNYIAD